MYYDPDTGVWRKNAEEYLAKIALSKLARHGRSSIVYDVVRQILDGQKQIDTSLPDADLGKIVLVTLPPTSILHNVLSNRRVLHTSFLLTCRADRESDS